MQHKRSAPEVAVVGKSTGQSEAAQRIASVLDGTSVWVLTPDLPTVGEFV
jgi:nicotinamide riboside kinase